MIKCFGNWLVEHYDTDRKKNPTSHRFQWIKINFEPKKTHMNYSEIHILYLSKSIVFFWVFSYGVVVVVVKHRRKIAWRIPRTIPQNFINFSWTPSQHETNILYTLHLRIRIAITFWAHFVVIQNEKYNIECVQIKLRTRNSSKFAFEMSQQIAFFCYLDRILSSLHSYLFIFIVSLRSIISNVWQIWYAKLCSSNDRFQSKYLIRFHSIQFFSLSIRRN